MLKSITLTITVLLLYGCGGDSNSQAVKEGYFLDSAVENLNYVTGSRSGKTDHSGAYEFAEGEEVSFSIGNIQFPRIAAKSLVTPLDFYSDTDLQHLGVVNMLRLLQTLDSDLNPENGITISDEIHTLASELSVNFQSLDFEMQVSGLIATIGKELVSAEQATEHFRAQLNNNDFDHDGFSDFEEYAYYSDAGSENSIPVVLGWETLQGNAAHNAYIPAFINPDNLSERWKIHVPEKDANPKKIAVADGKLFVTTESHTQNSWMFALDAYNGKEIWRENYEEIRDMDSPAYHDGVVYFHSSGSNGSIFRSLDAATGELIFQKRNNQIYNNFEAPMVVDGYVYYTGRGIYKYSIQDGEEQWHIDTIATTTIGKNTLFYISNGLHIVDLEGNEVAVVEDVLPSYWQGTISVLGLNSDLFIINDETLTAIDTINPSMKWSLKADFTGLPVSSPEYVFALNSGALSVLDAKSGQYLWSWEPDDNTQLDGNIIVTKNLVFVSGGNTTYAIDRDTQEQVWSYPMSGNLALGNDGALYISESSGFIASINISGDQDGDGMDDFWENRHGLAFHSADDATVDSDLDGLSNVEEYRIKTNPVVADSDKDGLIDGDEVNVYGTDPKIADSDNDDISDGDEILTYSTDPNLSDSDGDGLTDYDEVNTYLTNPSLSDSDSDGMADDWETINKLDPNNPDADKDPDLDGLTNLEESAALSNPYKQDSDGDGLSDFEEVIMYSTNPAEKDSDGDRIHDGWEVAYGLSPKLKLDAQYDSDSDGFTNLEEFYLATNPNDAQSVPMPDPWVTYQGNARHDGFSSFKINPDNISEIWRKEFDHSPHQVVEADGKVFVTTNVYSNTQKAYAFNVANGEKLWELDLGNIRNVNPPAYSNGKVVLQTVGSGNAFIRVVDANSGVIEMTSDYPNSSSKYKAPTVVGDAIYFGGDSSSRLYSYSLSGEENFHVANIGLDEWTPSVDGDSLYIYTHDGLKVLDRYTGSEHFTIPDENRSRYAYHAPGAVVVGSFSNVITIQDSRLLSFDIDNETVAWEKTAGFSNQPALGLGRIYAIRHGLLQSFDELSGNLLWSVQSGDNRDFQSNIVVTRNMVFIGTSETTYGIDIETQSVEWELQASGELTLSGGILYIAGERKVIAINIDGDDDGDGMLNWWEQVYGFNIADSVDAQLDKDGDGLSNLVEFQHGLYPDVLDSDGDSISDGDEVNIYQSNPLVVDTDGDGLNDADELSHGTSLLIQDTDNDGFNDNDEILIYGTSPTDANSLPAAYTSYYQSFEDGSMPADWSVGVRDTPHWYIDQTNASNGSFSIRSGETSHNGESILKFRGVFAAGTLRFDGLASSETCCDYVSVYVDGEYVQQVKSTTWQTYEVGLTSGQHIIEFIYKKDGSVHSGDDSVWIDNVRFER